MSSKTCHLLAHPAQQLLGSQFPKLCSAPVSPFCVRCCWLSQSYAPPCADCCQVKDEALKNLMMSWYYAGYYTGLYEGRQHAS